MTHTEVLTLPDVVKANSTSKCTAKPLVDTHKIIAESWYRCCIFMGAPTCFISEGIPFTRQDYFELVDWTGCTLREDKRGAIDSQLPPILQRLGIQPENWIDFPFLTSKNTFLMRRARFLLLSNSERGKIDSALSKGIQKGLLSG